MRTAFAILGAVAAIAVLGAVALISIDRSRKRGDLSLRPREAVKLKLATSDLLVHGERDEAVRWAADYVDEVLEVKDGVPTQVRRSWMGIQNGLTGDARAEALEDVTYIDAKGATFESMGTPWTKFPVVFPDPFYGLLPEERVYHSSEWEPSGTSASAVAAFLSRAPVKSARAWCRLESEISRDNLRFLRIRVRVKAALEEDRTLDAEGDLYFRPGDGLLQDMDWRGSTDGKKGEILVDFTRKRRVRK
jgi:hypothetical protein